LGRLRTKLVQAGDLARLNIEGLREERRDVLPGGLAIMSAVMDELGVERMSVAEGAMREGILYDMIGRTQHHDARDATVTQFMHRYHVDAPQAKRVGKLALQFYERLAGANTRDAIYLDWAARLHEIGISVAYSGYHRHSAYILNNADMPGFTREEQHRLAQLVLAHRRSLKKEWPQLDDTIDWRMVFALRMAVLFCQRRAAITPRILSARAGDNKFRLSIDPAWLARNPLTCAALREEIGEWEKIGFDVKFSGLEDAANGDALTMAS
jgi:exopolyphosphatase/guanosine-5'-triphosphate,3'-diphosphate pyrophosphatase